MFGNHDLKTAKRIAEEKTKELGKECAVFPAYDDKDKPIKGRYTIGVQIQGLTGDEFRAHLLDRIAKAKADEQQP